MRFGKNTKAAVAAFSLVAVAALTSGCEQKANAADMARIDAAASKAEAAASKAEQAAKAAADAAQRADAAAQKCEAIFAKKMHK